MPEIKNNFIRVRIKNCSKFEKKDIIIMSIKLATADFVIITFFVDFHDFVAFLPIDSLNERKPTSGF